MAGKTPFMHVFVVQVLLVFLVMDTCTTSKILMTIVNHKSHIHLFGNLGRALVDNGHDVWMITSDRFTKLIKGHKLVPLTLTVPKEADLDARLEQEMLKEPIGKVQLGLWPEPGRYCEEVLGNKYIMETIKEQNFDLVIVENSRTSTCLYTIPYKFNIPYITVYAMQAASWPAGVTGMPSIEPEVMTTFTNKMDFWQRLQNFKAWIRALQTPFMSSFDKYILQKYAPEKPFRTFYDIVRGSEMFLLNYDVFCLDYPRVSAPNFQFLGPSSISDAKPLPGDIQRFIEGAEDGVVIMAFGSFNAWQVTWHNLQEKMFNALGRLQQRAIVQYGLDSGAVNVPENILLLKYLPQNDILANPKTKLFITHGGNNGQNEAVHHGVPMLVMPLAADQPYACVRALARGYGRCIQDKEAITSDELHAMMQDVLTNVTYSANVKKCSRIMRSMPSAKERIVFWVNHILEFGGEHLRPPSLDMPLHQVLMFDIMAFFMVICLIAFNIVLFLVCYLCQCFLKAKKHKNE